MDEHDDDMTSEVHEGDDLETDSFPDTGDEVDAELEEKDDEDEDDEDKSEL